ncbi:calcium-binding protein [Leisingera sp. F5]|uniref:calcium-binding protein n=1 Tax=Leisingera sp. F5 TaxID=1813816 RepID=UPI000B09D507|nr:calcium-binding protein [Leisingera sp. F5]
MRDISTLPGQTLQSDIQGGDFNFVKGNLVSTFGGAIPPGTDDPVMTVDGTAYWEGAVFNYYDAESAADGLVSNDGWNRKLVILGSNMEFESAGVPTSGDIEAIVIMNAHEQVLVGAVDLEGVSAADFYAVWTSASTADDTAFINSIFENDGPEDDVITGTNRDDFIIGTADDDIINAGAGSDVVKGGSGNDTLSGNSGSDVLQGQGGHDRLFGNSGNDKLIGGAGRDVLKGGGGRDKLFGGSGKDLLKGGGGNDKLNGGTGNDKLIGNSGADDFIFSSGFDLVVDFGGRDQVDLRKASGISDFDDLISNHVRQGSKGVVITDDDGDAMRLNGIEISDLDQGDFIF